MVAQWRRWPNGARGNGGDALRWSDVIVLSRVGLGQEFVPFSRVPSSSFEGAARRSYGGGWHSVIELTLASPHNIVQWRRWPHRVGVGGIVPGQDSQAVSEDWRGEDLLLT
jgi:hypothetical protein